MDEKLVEEMCPLTAYIAGRLHAWAMLRDERVTIEQNVEEAQEIIASTLKAVVDGMPLQDELDRGAIWKNTTTGEWEVCREDASKWPEEGYVNFIALRKEEEDGD